MIERGSSSIKLDVHVPDYAVFVLWCICLSLKEIENYLEVLKRHVQGYISFVNDTVRSNVTGKLHACMFICESQYMPYRSDMRSVCVLQYQPSTALSTLLSVMIYLMDW